MANYTYDIEDGTGSEFSASDGAITYEAPGLADTGFALKVTPASNTDTYVSTGSLGSSAAWELRFYIDLADLSMNNGDFIRIFSLRGSDTVLGGPTSGTNSFVNLRKDSGNYQIQWGSYDTANVYGDWITISTTTEHYIEVNYAANSHELWVDGVSSYTNTSTGSGNSSYGFFGGASNTASGGVFTGSGTFKLDQIQLNQDSTYIGPYDGQPEGMITFEDGALGELGTPVETGSATISSTSGSALASTGYGCAVATNGTDDAYAEKAIAIPVDSVFRFRFYIDPNSATFPTSAVFNMMNFRDGSQGRYAVRLNYDGSSREIDVWNGTGSPLRFDITDAPHYVEVLFDMAAGTADTWIDGVAQTEVTGGANAAVTKLRVGTEGVGGLSGTIFVDEIVWRPYNVEIGAWDANILDVDFETGSTSPGAETIGAGGAIAVNPTAALNSSNFGLALDPGTSGTDATYDLPGIAATTIRTRVYLDTNDWANTSADVTNGPIFFMDDATTMFGLQMIDTSGTITIKGWYKDNGGNNAMGTLETISAGAHWIETEMVYHASAGAYRWWLDGVLVEEDTGLATDSVTIPNKLRVGFTSMAAGGTGTAYIDELIVRNSSTAIGTDGAGLGFEIDLTTSIATSNATPDQDENFTITVDVTNASAAQVDATGVTVSIPVPANADYVSDDSSSEYVSGTGVWTLTSIAPGATESIVITFNMNNTTLTAFTAEVTAANETDSTSTWNNGSGDDFDTVDVTGQAVGGGGGAPQIWRFSR